MPKVFTECASKPGAKIRTVNISATKYMKVCLTDKAGPKGGHSVGGETKTRKSAKK